MEIEFLVDLMADWLTDIKEQLNVRDTIDKTPYLMISENYKKLLNNYLNVNNEMNKLNDVIRDWNLNNKSNSNDINGNDSNNDNNNGGSLNNKSNKLIKILSNDNDKMKKELIELYRNKTMNDDLIAKHKKEINELKLLLIKKENTILNLKKQNQNINDELIIYKKEKNRIINEYQTLKQNIKYNINNNNIQYSNINHNNNNGFMYHNNDTNSNQSLISISNQSNNNNNVSSPSSKWVV